MEPAQTWGGHLGNELADLAAKAGLHLPVNLFPFTPKTFFKQTIGNRIYEITQHRWDSSQHSQWISSLFPSWTSLQSFFKFSDGLLFTRKVASGCYPTQDYLYIQSLPGHLSKLPELLLKWTRYHLSQNLILLRLSMAKISINYHPGLHTNNSGSNPPKQWHRSATSLK